MKEKVDPYLRPLYDALYDLFGYEQIQRKIDNGSIEIAPLAFMRGRTLKTLLQYSMKRKTQPQLKLKCFNKNWGKFKISC